MNIALCVIGRLENQYVVEFVEWYKKLGFNKIIIYDNNHDGEEFFEEVIQQYIDDGIVEIVPYRDMENVQIKAYSDCYIKYNSSYDWIAFFDFDEFLVLKNHSTIQEYLEWISTKGDFDCVKINWMIYTDADMVENDGRLVNERFTVPMEYDKKIGFDFPQNNHTKSIVKCKTEYKVKLNPHIPIVTKKICNADGIEDNDTPFTQYTFENAYLKHFTTKTIDEFIHNKMVRGLGDRTHKEYMDITPIKEFFKVNDMTSEKREYLIKNGFKTDNDNIDIFITTHKDFSTYTTNPIYKIVDSRDIDFSKYRLKDDFYSELISYFNVADKYELKDYVGFCHYRRYFSFMDNIPNMDELFKEYDIVLASPETYDFSIWEHYKKYHNIEDLAIVSGVLAKRYPDYVETWNKFLDMNIFFPCNMFIMKKENFLDYIKFMKDILDGYLDVVGTDIWQRIGDNKKKYLKDFYPNSTIEYQYRIGGFLGERLTNAFIKKRFRKVITYDIKITEEKY